MKKKEAKVESVMGMRTAIDYMDEIVTAMKAGQVSVLNGNQGITLASSSKTVRQTFSRHQRTLRHQYVYKITR